MTITATEIHPSYAQKTEFTEEDRRKIRTKLKVATGYAVADEIDLEQNSELHHTKEVPFEGTVYPDAGSDLNSSEIDKKYRQSLDSIWWISLQLMLTPIRRLKHRFT